MWYWILQIIVNALVLLGASRILLNVEVKDFKTALLVSLFIGLISILVGGLFTIIINIATLGIFVFLGLGFVTRIISFAIVIEIVDRFSSGFKTHGFLPSLWLAIILATVGLLMDSLLL